MRTAVRTLVVCLLAAAPAARAQKSVPAFELERLQLNPGAEGNLTHSLGELLPAWHYRMSFGLHYEKNPLTLYGQGGYVGALVSDRFTMHLTGAISFHDRFRVGLHFPFLYFQGGQDLTGVGWTNPAPVGLGSPYVSLAGAALIQRNGAPLDLSGQLGVAIPFGSQAALGAWPGPTFVPSLAAGRSFELLRLGLELAFVLRPGVPLTNAAASSSNVMASEMLINAGIATVKGRFRGELSAKGSIGLAGVPGGLELLLGGRFDISEHFELFAVTGPGFGLLPGTPAFRVLAGLAYKGAREEAPEPTDICAPGQEHLPSQCPELDDDGDGVKNADDLCPTEPGTAEAKGCQPVAKVADADGDGVPDDQDKCPKEKGDAAQGGCPVQDTDKDKDGIDDMVDGCPDQAGPKENLGCPDLDSDGDGTIDKRDNCPKEAGPQDNQGCPAAKKQLVVLTADKLDIKEKVFFATGKAAIDKKSFELLDQVAAVLKAHPEVKQVSIEGHTDNVGDAGKNRKLSQARADAVKTYLVKKGVQKARLVAKGWGPDKPAQPNDTDAGKEANRRVEFLIVGVAAK